MLTSPEFFRNPEPTLARLRAEDPVHFDEELVAWVLTRHDDVDRVIRDARFSVDRNGRIARGGSPKVKSKIDFCNDYFAKWMVFSDPPRQLRLRSLVAHAFQPKTLALLGPLIEEVTDELVTAAARRGTFDAMADLGLPLPIRITSHLLGLPDIGSEVLSHWTSSMFVLFGASAAKDSEVERAYDSLLDCREFFAELVDQRRRRPGDDVISHIARTAGPDLSADEVVGLCITLVAGSYETTSYLITNGIHALLTHPDELSALREQPGLMEGAVEELMRFVGPALSVQRRATVNVEMRGKRIREKDVVYCILHAANHDPEVFAEPECLDVRRTPCPQLGFGAGGHFCLGAWLSRLEARAAFSAVVQRFPELKLGDFEPEWTNSLAIRGLPRLPLVTGRPSAVRSLSGTLPTIASARARSAG